ncbi:DUF7344 domain-containing protein [Halorubrum miltondacostae]|uniref:DUF7344 domain-containing protein n=1 Tax=Halorubrum miltondacostae TaxID=3076378 RepID=UPI0040557FAE
MFQRTVLPEVEVYQVLSNSRRREALTELWGQTEPMSLRELSETIAAAEAGYHPAPRPLRKSVTNTLHQTHLPKMHELGLVEYDSDRKVVSACPEARQVRRYMDVTTGLGVTWGEYYRALGILGLFFTVTAHALPPEIGGISPLVPATLFLCLFALSTIYQLFAARLRISGRGEHLRARLFKNN